MGFLNHQFNLFDQYMRRSRVINRNYHVKNQIGMSGAFYHAEIMHGNLWIDAANQTQDFIVDGNGFRILILNGIHMDNGIAVQLAAQFPLDVVNGIMECKNVAGSRNFTMERNHLTARAVVVNQHIVNT